MIAEKIVVRMPPSPTGPLHLGTARTALFNYLFAKHFNGKIVFRWEDTDTERSEKKYETEILEGLKWLGLDFEKEADSFFRQTENKSTHKKFLSQLWEQKSIFPCFTSPEEIQLQREKAAQERKNFVFWSPFRNFSPQELKKKMKSGEKFVWRIRCPKDEKISFHDLIRGEIQASSNTLGDFVIARNDDSVLYLLGNVIDDSTQGITHVLRGEDHISNTPKQILLYRALGFSVPHFGHIPLVLDQKKRKLSKRNVDRDTCVLISDFQKAGFVPEAVVNGLAFLGWNPKTTQEIFSQNELISAFDIRKVNPGAAQYDFEKMKWFNTQWLKKIPISQLISYCNLLAKTNFNESQNEKEFEIAREKSRNLHDVLRQLEYLISDPGIEKEKILNEKMKIDSLLALQALGEIKMMLEVIDVTKFNRKIIREASVQKIQNLKLKNGQFLSPFRIALSNRDVSAGPFEIAEVLGKTETLRRIERAEKCFQS
jgi:glutamyl-tRNA synthetase